jgi:hypothetical protein
MAFARDEDSRLASFHDPCCQGDACARYGGRTFPPEEETRADAAVHQRVPHSPATALRDARESNALMPAVQSLCNG